MQSDKPLPGPAVSSHTWCSAEAAQQVKYAYLLQLSFTQYSVSTPSTFGRLLPFIPLAVASHHALQAHAELPIVLVLGMATSAGALQQMLPVAAASMLEPQHFQLTSSMER